MTHALILQSSAVSALLDRLRTMSSNARSGLENALLGVGIALAGWLLAALLARLLRAVLRLARFNEGARRLFGGGALGAHEPASIASGLLFWGLLATALVLALDAAGFGLGSALAQRLADVLPRVLAAAILLVAGVVFAMAMGALTRRFFETAGLAGGRPRGQIVTILFTFFSVLLALDQLGFAAQFVMAVGVVITASLGLAAALAFGLGCRDLARDFIVEYLRSLEHDERPRA